MWQQSDCNIRNATRQNSSGCLNDLYPFVITTYTSQPDPNSFPVANEVDDYGGGNSMAFYNMQAKDATDFFAAVDDGTLPAVSFVKPDGLLDGHPASSKEDLFEGMVKKILDHLTANKELFESTVLFITMDEGGGYYDSGYIQPLDFFGDGPRIPLIAVSPFSRGGHVSHTYTDHVSILKFIERNWKLKPLTERSRDNLPNPKSFDDNPYVPKNSPAIGDLFDLFDFDHGHDR